MLCALVNKTNNNVESLILADPLTFTYSENHLVIGLPEGTLVRVGWKFREDDRSFVDQYGIQIQNSLKL